jgi:hypothetical protein
VATRPAVGVISKKPALPSTMRTLCNPVARAGQPVPLGRVAALFVPAKHTRVDPYVPDRVIARMTP